mmetsp:Transcript_9542/g.31615  ORF Transcript_9542/g.31615 Transcript_9542/m.31615 type:complete len:251 (-) Transcript_9542:1281-2033(-)
MRTKVVSWDKAAVTLLLGVLHVPQLYSPCFVAASTIAATVIPAVPLCANKTNALFLIVPASYPSAVASWFQPTRRFLVAAAAFVSDCLPTGTFVPTNVPSDPELSPGLTFTPPGVPPPAEVVVAGVVGGTMVPSLAAAVAFSSSSTRRRLLVAIFRTADQSEKGVRGKVNLGIPETTRVSQASHALTKRVPRRGRRRARRGRPREWSSLKRQPRARDDGVRAWRFFRDLTRAKICLGADTLESGTMTEHA